MNMQWTYPLPYSVIGFYLIQAVNDGKTCTINELKQNIYERTLADFFKINQIRVDPSLLTAELYTQLTDIVETDIDYKLLADAKNGYLMLTAYLLEFIQRNAPHRNTR